MATWITVGAKGTNHIGDIKTKLKGSTQRNTMNISDLRRQIAFFKEMETDLRNNPAESDLEPSKVMKDKLERIKKAQEKIETSLKDIVMLLCELTSCLSEIQNEPGITEEHIV